jgi:osmotically-inducible protein OsmY
MAQAKTSTTIPDADLQRALDHAVITYPPLVNDRGHFAVTVKNGAVTVSGHVKTVNSQDVLLDRLAGVDGVKSVKNTKLYADETVRLAVGQVIPFGVFTTVEYGTVILSGRLPEGDIAEAVTKKVARVKGVNRVVTAFRD